MHLLVGCRGSEGLDKNVGQDDEARGVADLWCDVVKVYRLKVPGESADSPDIFRRSGRIKGEQKGESCWETLTWRRKGRIKLIKSGAMAGGESSSCTVATPCPLYLACCPQSLSLCLSFLAFGLGVGNSLGCI